MDKYSITITDIAVGESFQCINRYSSEHKKQRAMKEENSVFLFNPRSSRYGHRYSTPLFERHFIIIPPKDKTEEWHKRIRRALKAMEGSGLWPDLKERFTNLLSMTWEDHEKMNRLYWEADFKGSIRIFPPDVWDPWYRKYPFLKCTAADGRDYPNTDYLWELSRVQLKSMYFGKALNKEYKERIKTAIKERSQCVLSARTSYDVSFEYRPDKNMAFYSEEYKGCGNGHYYLALNETLALFCEDD